MTLESSWPNPPVARRERTHRRAVLLALSILLVLAISPLVIHHLPVGLDRYLAGRDHVWTLCLVALHVMLAPVHGVFHILLFTGIAYGIWDRTRAWRIRRAALSSLAVSVPQPGDPFSDAAATARVDPGCVCVAESLPNPAFTTGWWRPRIYLSSKLPAFLSPAELVAVLAHEGRHLSRRDPMRLEMLRFLSRALFWLPVLLSLAEDVADETEIQADDEAASLQPLALAAAIVKLAQWPFRPEPLAHGIGFNDGGLLDRRVRRLAGEHVIPRSRVTRRSLAGAVLVLSLILASAGVTAHPLSGHAAEHGPHCDGHEAAALFHLFCEGVPGRTSAGYCLHRLH